MTWRKVFQIPRPAPGLSGPGDQKIDFDAAGNLFIAELASSPTLLQDFIYRQTGAPDDPLTPGQAYGDDQPHLAVDKSAAGVCFNQLYSPWLNFSLARERSIVSFSPNAGVTMTDVGVGDNTAFPNRTTRIALAPDGRAYVIYKTREGLVGGEPLQVENAHFRVARSDNCGQTWDALGVGGVSVHGPTAVQTFFTNQFGNPAKGKVARARSSDAWIAVDPGIGDIFAAHVRKDASGFGQIYVAHSADLGVTWTSTRVTDGTHHSAYPEIAVADNGTVGVLYIDFDDSGPTTIFRHRFARSFDGGATWTDQILQNLDPGPLANAPNGFLWGDYEGLTAFGTTFYGVFTGQSIGRTTAQLDPIFFTERAEIVCPRSQGFWKTHPDAWPVTSLTLGSQTYTQAELLALFDTPPRGDASLILVDQLIAAKLNIANGSDPTPISTTIADADSLLSGFAGKLPYHVRPSSPTGQAMVNDATVLDSYNNGELTPNCTP
jgi:hypothetical protein